jgi:hypothetical protein
MLPEIVSLTKNSGQLNRFLLRLGAALAAPPAAALAVHAASGEVAAAWFARGLQFEVILDFLKVKVTSHTESKLTLTFSKTSW